MNIQPESSHHEQGPGQNEVDFRYAEALEAADNFVTFKWVVKSMASSSGLYASFLPKPLPSAPGSGLHLSISIVKDGKNLFHPSFADAAAGRSFVAGILRRAAEMTAFGNPLTNSYLRLGEFEAPKYITWSHRNRSPLISVPLTGGGQANRMKVRAFDGCINPYIVFALLIHAGLDGMEQRLPLAPACDENLFTAPDTVRAQYEALPGSLCDAIRCAESSEFIARYLPQKAREAFFAAKQAEHDRIALADDRIAAERILYFERYRSTSFCLSIPTVRKEGTLLGTHPDRFRNGKIPYHARAVPHLLRRTGAAVPRLLGRGGPPRAGGRSVRPRAGQHAPARRIRPRAGADRGARHARRRHPARQGRDRGQRCQTRGGRRRAGRAQAALARGVYAGAAY